MIEKDTSWGHVASWYDELVEDTKDSYQKNVVMPNLIRLVGPKPGMKILDVACGQGYFSRAFADNGADVIACDISKELIELAKGYPKKGKGNIEYHATASDRIPTVTDQSVDVAVIVLALQNIDRMLETLGECGRVLKSHGRLIVILNHPAFRIPKRSSWRWDPADDRSRTSDHGDKSAKMFRRIDGYMSDAQIDMDMTPGETDHHKKKYTTSFHRPLQSYFKVLSKSGFSVTRLEEWISHKKSLSGPRSMEEDRMRKEIPIFLMIEGRKD